MEVIDKVTIEVIIHSEKKFIKIRAGEVPFSDKLAKAGRCIQVYNLVMHHEESNGLNTRVTRRKVKRSGLTRVLEESLSSSKLKLSREWKDHKTQKICMSFTPCIFT